MPESIRHKDHTVHRDPGNALEGDQILIECRKITDWSKSRGSEQHHYFSTVIRKNAYAVIKRKFTNIKD